MNELVSKKEQFITALAESYPEKAVFLMGMDFDIMHLVTYNLQNNTTPETFDPHEFKKYLDTQTSFYPYTALPTMSPAANAVIGSIYFDTTTHTLMLFDGTSWVSVK